MSTRIAAKQRKGRSPCSEHNDAKQSGHSGVRTVRSHGTQHTGSTCIEVRRCTVVSVRQIEIDFINDIDYSPHKSSSYCADNSAQQLQV